MYPCGKGVQLSHAPGRGAWSVLFLLPWAMWHNLSENQAPGTLPKETHTGIVWVLLVTCEQCKTVVRQHKTASALPSPLRFFYGVRTIQCNSHVRLTPTARQIPRSEMRSHNRCSIIVRYSSKMSKFSTVATN
jgi:hypothetical protein